MNDSAERVAPRNFKEETEDLPAAPSSHPVGPVTANGVAPGRELAPLLRTIEVEIIPRLILARRVSADAGAGMSALCAERTVELTDLVLSGDCPAAGALVDGLRARGAPVESIYLDLLAPTARRLGDLWIADLCSFADVTLALGSLQQLMHELGGAFRDEAEHHEWGRRALLVPLPGEQHTFGLVMVAEFFRRASWDVWSGSVPSAADLVRRVREEWFAIVGFSVSSDRSMAMLASSIRAVRRASCNRSIGVMVGGPVFVDRPDLAALVGADATALDGRQAVTQAQNLLSLLPQRC